MNRTQGPMRCLQMSIGAAAIALSGSALAQSSGASNSPGPSVDVAAISRRATDIDTTGVYLREVQACLSGRSQQSKETCLEEARNARAAKLRGKLHDQGEDYTANALARCEPLRGEDRAACHVRVMGFGGTSGSVAGGGLLRWVETVVVPAGQETIGFTQQTAEPAVVLVAPRS